MKVNKALYTFIQTQAVIEDCMVHITKFKLYYYFSLLVEKKKTVYKMFRIACKTAKTKFSFINTGRMKPNVEIQCLSQIWSIYSEHKCTPCAVRCSAQEYPVILQLISDFKTGGQPNTRAFPAYLKSCHLGQTVEPLPLIAVPAPENLPRPPGARHACWPGRHYHHGVVAVSQSVEGIT